MPPLEPVPGTLLIFCGLPGTLKTFLSARVAATLGLVYMPTRAVGEIEAGLASADLNAARQRRYARLGSLVGALVASGVSVVADGGFPTVAARALVRGDVSPLQTTVVYCRCVDTTTRHERLRRRAAAMHDHEARSAGEILAGGAAAEWAEESPRDDLDRSIIVGLLEVETDTSRQTWRGTPAPHLAATLPALIIALLAEHATLSRAE